MRKAYDDMKAYEAQELEKKEKAASKFLLHFLISDIYSHQFQFTVAQAAAKEAAKKEAEEAAKKQAQEAAKKEASDKKAKANSKAKVKENGDKTAKSSVRPHLNLDSSGEDFSTQPSPTKSPKKKSWVGKPNVKKTVILKNVKETPKPLGKNRKSDEDSDFIPDSESDVDGDLESVDEDDDEGVEDIEQAGKALKDRDDRRNGVPPPKPKQKRKKNTKNSAPRLPKVRIYKFHIFKTVWCKPLILSFHRFVPRKL